MANDYPPEAETRLVMLTETDDEGTNVLCRTTLTADEVRRVYTGTNVRFDDVFEIKPEEAQYYLYDSCMLTVKEEAEARRRLAAMS